MELGIIVVFAIVVGLVTTAIMVVRHRKVKDEVSREMKRIEDGLKVKRANWQRRIDSAEHLLTGSSWRDPEGKVEFVLDVYQEVPDYQWYALGSIESLNEEEIKFILWKVGIKNPGFGDIELHRSSNPGVGTALRVRNATKIASTITIRDQDCPLYQTGHSFMGETVGCVNFMRLYKKTQLVS